MINLEELKKIKKKEIEKLTAGLNKTYTINGLTFEYNSSFVPVIEKTMEASEYVAADIEILLQSAVQDKAFFKYYKRDPKRFELLYNSILPLPPEINLEREEENLFLKDIALYYICSKKILNFASKNNFLRTYDWETIDYNNVISFHLPTLVNLCAKNNIEFWEYEKENTLLSSKYYCEAMKRIRK